MSGVETLAAATTATAMPASVAAVPAAAGIYTAFDGAALAALTTGATGGGFSLGTTLLMGATALDVLGSISDAESQAKAMEYNAKIIEQNARINEENARRQGRSRLSAINAAYGKSGVQMQGTPIEVLSGQAGEIELEALASRYQGAMEASAKRYQASQTRTGGYWGAAGSLLKGATKGYYMANGTRGVGASLLS